MDQRNGVGQSFSSARLSRQERRFSLDQARNGETLNRSRRHKAKLLLEDADNLGEKFEAFERQFLAQVMAFLQTNGHYRSPSKLE